MYRGSNVKEFYQCNKMIVVSTAMEGIVRQTGQNLFWIMFSVLGVLLSLYELNLPPVRKRGGGEIEMWCVFFVFCLGFCFFVLNLFSVVVFKCFVFGGMGFAGLFCESFLCFSLLVLRAKSLSFP